MKRGLLFLVILVLISGEILAQGCSLCTATAAGLDDKSAKGLNGGILYLATLPLMLIGAIGFIWWRQHGNHLEGKEE